MRFVQLWSTRSLTGLPDWRKDTRTLNELLREIQSKGGEVLDVKVSIGVGGHSTTYTTCVYLIIYESDEPIDLEARKDTLTVAKIRSVEIKGKSIREMYDELLELYLSSYGYSGRAKLERAIEDIMRTGASREEAIKWLYKKEKL